MSFYLTYRPQVIGEIDNVAVREQLLSLLSKDKKQLPHAYLFTGPRGAGKTTAARVIAKLFNCTHPSTRSGPCGKCDQCKSISDGRNLDVLEIDAASNRGIDEIRQLRDAINLAPSSADYKIYIIDEVHMLTTEAFNALLKTLEEPPAHAVFVLATTDPQKVPATIKSRCVPISFHRASSSELMEALKRIVTAEKISIDDEALTLLAGSVDGSFRDAVKTLELVSFHKGKITEDIVRSLVSLTDVSIATAFLEAVRKHEMEKALKVVTQLVSDGKDIKTFLTSCLEVLEDYLVATVTKQTDFHPEELQQMIHTFTEAYGMMKISPILQLPLELAVVELCTASSAANVTPPPQHLKQPEPAQTKKPTVDPAPDADATPSPSLGLLTLEKLTEHWPDFIAELKPYNHSVAAVLRSARPKGVDHGIVTIEAFYPFHKDKLSESKTKDVLVTVLKKLFGEKVKVDIVLGKK